MYERFHHNKGPTSKRVYKGEEVREEGGGGGGGRGGLEKSWCENMREERLYWEMEIHLRVRDIKCSPKIMSLA